MKKCFWKNNKDNNEGKYEPHVNEKKKMKDIYIHEKLSKEVRKSSGRSKHSKFFFLNTRIRYTKKGSIEFCSRCFCHREALMP